MAMNPQYWAFISYSHKDRRWCDWLHRAIETYSVPPRLVGREAANGMVPRRIYPIFRDRDELSSSADLTASVSDALQNSRYLLVICSPAAAASQWVNEEIRRFKALGRAHRILCLIVDGDPPSCFPPSLFDPIEQREVESSQAVEPLAADLRSGHDGPAGAKLKLIAALLGLRFDELVQRDRQRQRQGQMFGIVLGCVLASLLLLPDFGPLPSLRLAAFDAYQALFPRVRSSAPVAVVAIDKRSISRIGQWPWPRHRLAELINQIAARKPAVIGVNILFPEPDRLSPEHLVQELPMLDPKLASALEKLPHFDTLLAEAIRRAKAVVIVAGEDERSSESERGIQTAFIEKGPHTPLYLFAGQTRSLREIDDAAAGHGLANVFAPSGVARSVQLVAQVGDSPILTLALECLRVAQGADRFTLVSNDRGLQQIVVGDLAVPVQPDGSIWVHFSAPEFGRQISAIDLLEGRYESELLDHKIVLIEVTATGLSSSLRTPNGVSILGAEMHAELIENIFDSSILTRPAWARFAEALVFLICGSILIVTVRRVSPRLSAGIPIGCSVLVVGACFASFRFGRILFDWATVITALALLFAATMTYGFAINAQRQLPDR